MASVNPYANLQQTVTVDGQEYRYFNLPLLKDARLESLPYSIRVLLESAVRNCDNFQVLASDVETILNWKENAGKLEIPFKPARVLLQDFTGVPAVVDLAAMRDALSRFGRDPSLINPLVPVDLVIDHSVQVDFNRSPDAADKNTQKEFERNSERFRFLKWGAKSFENLLIVPPGSGIVHQVNLEYLAHTVFKNSTQKGEAPLLYPDSVVGTDSHTTMINGLGVCGWGVGGIEAEAVMLGQAISMVLPEVVGYKLTGKLPLHATATDLVLTITKNLRKLGVVNKFVEFFGEGVQHLSIADRATLSNMAPEYGATIGFFPVDNATLQYLRQSGRDEDRIAYIEASLRAQGLFRDYSNVQDPHYTTVLELDLSTLEACLAGPKRPHDHVPLKNMQEDFRTCLTAKTGFKGFGLSAEKAVAKTTIEYEGKNYELANGSVVISAITSCTNTSNPSVMLGAGLLAKKAVEKGLTTLPYIKTSLSPGSGVVKKYLEASGLQTYLDQLGYNIVGYGCMTCIGNSGELPTAVSEAIVKEDLVAAGVLSGNRNFEGRIHPHVRANYLASPPLVVAYSIAGTVNIDLENEPIGVSSIDGKPVFLKDIWPSSDEIQEVVNKCVLPSMFKQVYESITQGNSNWNALEAPTGTLFPWDNSSTYIHNPPFFATMGLDTPSIGKIENAYCLLNVGDSITTDHISPAGSISTTSPAARYLQERGVTKEDFNTYGARRGNDEIMARGTFANTRLINKFLTKPAPRTVHVPTSQEMDVFDAAMQYKKDGHSLIILAGADYGSGSSRDWAAKGPYLQGVKAVIATSFERIHRSNLVGMGIIPLQFEEGQDADKLGLTGRETFTIDLPENLIAGQRINVKTSDKEFTVKLRFDTDVELTYFRHGGILQYVLRRILKESEAQ